MSGAAPDSRALLFDQLAGAYDTHMSESGHVLGVRHLVQAVLPARAPRRIVELGCGTGQTTELLRRTYPDAEILGIDISEEMLERARLRLGPASGVRFLRGALETMDPANLHADLAVAVYTVCWFDLPRVAPVLARQLTPDGHLLVVDDVALPEPIFARKFPEIAALVRQSRIMRTREDVEGILASAGLGKVADARERIRDTHDSYAVLWGRSA